MRFRETLSLCFDLIVTHRKIDWADTEDAESEARRVDRAWRILDRVSGKFRGAMNDLYAKNPDVYERVYRMVQPNVDGDITNIFHALGRIDPRPYPYTSEEVAPRPPK